MQDIIKMADQIEMSSVENPKRNAFGPMPNFLGRPTFSFKTASEIGKTPNSSWTPFNLEMVRYKSRADTFLNKWPVQMSQRPHQMATSGFYYNGYGDTVTCFFCGISIRCWERTDGVDAEHKKHSPDCKYLLMCCQV